MLAVAFVNDLLQIGCIANWWKALSEELAAAASGVCIG